MESLQDALVYSRRLSAALLTTAVSCRTYWAQPPIVGVDGSRISSTSFSDWTYEMGPVSVNEVLIRCLETLTLDAAIYVPSEQLEGRTTAEIRNDVFTALVQLSRSLAGPATFSQLRIRWQRGLQVVARCT